MYIYIYYRSCRPLSYCIKTAAKCANVIQYRIRSQKQSLVICGKQKMSAMGHGFSVTMSSTPTMLQWQNCVGHVSCFCKFCSRND